MLRNLMIAAGAFLAVASATASAQAATIVPVSATGSSSYPGYNDFYAIDQGPGSATSDWASLGQGANSFLNLDLGAVYDLDVAYVTDRTTSGAGNNGWVGGMWDFTTSFSLQAFSDASFSQAAGSALVFNKTAPQNPMQPSDFLYVANVSGLQGQFLQYKVLATNGVNPGLSDIHFSGDAVTGGAAAVPEAATWAMMLVGFGGMGALLRARRALTKTAQA